MAGNVIDDQPKLAEFIRDQCNENWRTNHTALQLTRLGSLIRQHLAPGTTLEALAPNRLLEFIRTQVPEVSTREPNPYSGKIGIVPASAEVTDVISLFPEQQPATTDAKADATSTQRGLRYISAFWNALKQPLENQRRRYLTPDLRRYNDLREDEHIPPGSIELDPSYIAGIDGPPSAAEASRIHQNIDQFFQDHPNLLPLRPIEPPPMHPPSAVTLRTPARHAVSPADHLVAGQEMFDFARGIAQLSNTDLARIHIPLDLVLQLLRKIR